MARIEVQKSTDSTAAPEEIFPLLENSATYPLWSMIDYFESLRGGQGGLHGVGSHRLFRTGRFSIMHEQIVDIVPNRRVSYILLSGFPLADYQSTTTLEPLAAGTRITWRSTFYPKHPLTGWFWRALMNWVLTSMVRSLARAAEDPERRKAILALAHGGTSAKSAAALSMWARPDDRRLAALRRVAS
jgi:hypothetical protein